MRCVAVGLLLALAGLVTPGASAQRALAGRVTDAATGEPLPGANVAVLGPDGAVVGGTATNTEGQFALRLERVPADLAVRYVGFETAWLRVTDATPVPLACQFAAEHALGVKALVGGAGPGGVGYTAFGALRSRTDVPDAGDRYALAAWEHSFQNSHSRRWA